LTNSISDTLKNIFQIFHFLTAIFTGNLAGIPLAQQLGLFTFLLVALIDLALTGFAFPVSEHE
jgi:hypothetical protein